MVRRADKAKTVVSGAAEAPLRQATLDQRHEIMDLLRSVYDRAARRYSGGETDKTVADTIGGGCLPGWVAELREEWFGPDGGNADMAALRVEIEACAGRAFAASATADQALRAAADATATAVSLTKRLDAVCRAVGPKARV